MSGTPSPALMSIAAFLRLTKLEPHHLLSLLQSGAVAFQAGPAGELLLDPESVDDNLLANKAGKEGSLISAEEQVLLEEVVAAELLSALEPLLDEALSLAQSWLANEEEPAENPDPADLPQ